MREIGAPEKSRGYAEDFLGRGRCMKWALTDFEKISAAHVMREDDGKAYNIGNFS